MPVDILSSSVSDNYFYVLHDADGTAAVIDPVDADTAIAHIRERGYDLQWVVNTHFHHDHVAGDDAVLDAFPGAKLTAGPDHENINVDHEFDLILNDGDSLEVGTIQLDVFATPGHTPGHISLLGEGALFSGDVIFAGGAGNCRFGGDPAVLFRTYRDVISQFEDDVAFYPGHDYARRNIEFALSIEPGNDAARAMLDRVESHPGGLFATTLGEERRYNPFFRFGDAALRTALQAKHADVWEAERADSESDDEATFRTVRELRNNW